MKKLFIGLGVLIVLIIAAVIVIPLVIPVDTYEGKVIALVKQSTGRTLQISGPVKLSLLPKLALEANDVALANAPGAQAPQMVKLKQLQVQLQLLPLLHGNIAISRLILVDPVIALEIDKAGHPNWVFTPAAPAAAAPSAPAPSAAAPSAANPLGGLSLEDLRLTDGKVSYYDARSGVSKEVGGINMTLSERDLDSPLKADGSAVWNGEKVTLKLDVDNPNALLRGTASRVGLTLAANPINFSYSGSVTGLPPTKANGVVDFATPSLRNLAKWGGTPIAMSGTGLGPLKIQGAVDMTGTKYIFSKASIALDAITANGTLGLDTGGARPAFTGQLAVDKLDLNPYLPPATQSAVPTPAAGAGGAPAAQAGWSDAPIDVSALKAADIDFTLQAGSILYRKFVIGQSALALHLKNAQLVATLSQMALYSGTGQGKVTIDGSGAVPALAMNFDLAKVKIEPLAEAAMGSARISGTGSFSMAVTGHGKSQRDLIGTLDGKGALNLADGQLKGVDLLDLAEKAVKSGGGGGGGSTDFGTLSATYTITNGVLRTTDLQLKSGAVPMTGSGSTSLPARTLDFEIAPQLPGGIAVPIKITGPWDNPSYRPDVSKLLQDAAKDPSKMLNSLKSGGGAAAGAGAGASTLLKGLFGK